MLNITSVTGYCFSWKNSLAQSVSAEVQGLSPGGDKQFCTEIRALRLHKYHLIL